MRARNLIPFCGTTVICLGLFAGGGGCQRPAEQPEASPSNTKVARSGVVTGTVQYIELEGGFYGIVTDDGKKLNPVNLPQEFRQDGLRLKARVVPLEDVVSIQMWGTPVRIVSFKRLPSSGGYAHEN